MEAGATDADDDLVYRETGDAAAPGGNRRLAANLVAIQERRAQVDAFQSGGKHTTRDIELRALGGASGR